MVQIAKLIDGVHTEILLQKYSDCTLVLLTQLGTVGCLIQARLPSTYPLIPLASEALSPPPVSIQLTPLLGQAPISHLQTLYNLYVSQIATLVWLNEGANGLRAPVIVGVALKLAKGTTQSSEEDEPQLSEMDRMLFSHVMKMLKEVLQ